MRSSQNRDALVGGLVFLVVAVLLMFSTSGPTASTGASATSFPVKAVFNRVDGLFEGDEVRLAGIRVGSVGTNSLNTDFRAEVTLNIDAGVELPVDSAVAIHTDGLFGSKFVVIEPGIEDGLLHSGSEFQYTQGAVVVSELLGLIIDEGKARLAKAKKTEATTTPTQSGDR